MFCAINKNRNCDKSTISTSGTTNEDKNVQASSFDSYKKMILLNQSGSSEESSIDEGLQDKKNDENMASFKRADLFLPDFQASYKKSNIDDSQSK